MKAKKPAKTVKNGEYRLLLRLEGAIADRVKARADQAKRSINQQINYELDQKPAWLKAAIKSATTIKPYGGMRLYIETWPLSVLNLLSFGSASLRPGLAGCQYITRAAGEVTNTWINKNHAAFNLVWEFGLNVWRAGFAWFRLFLVRGRVSGLTAKHLKTNQNGLRGTWKRF